MSAATEDMHGYGPLALYAGEGCQVQFREIAYRDLAMRRQPIEEVGKGFRMQRLNPFFYGWSADAADFNRDGKLDIVSGPFIYYGPDFTQSHEIYPAQGVNTSTNYPMDDWVEHAYDFTGDGFTVVSPIDSEETVLADVDGDGKPELVYVAEGYMRYAKPDPAIRSQSRGHGPRLALALAILTVMGESTSWAPMVGGNNLRRTPATHC